ncbi:hypothetical protein H0H93_012830 [Arthromyces matolae]|nr:hypothetical protein H0H93_012830 [Arthromyces matolae]
MTNEQRELVDRRDSRVREGRTSENFPESVPSEIFEENNVPSASESSITEAGTTVGKGKGIDPRNWGALADISDTELDPRVQHQLLKSKGKRDNILPDKSIDEHVDEEVATHESNIAESSKIKDESPTREEIVKYLRDKRKLVKELDRLRQKQKSSHNERDRSGSLPVSDKLATLIGKVTGSRAKSTIDNEHKDETHHKSTSNNKSVTKPIAQVAGKSGLGRAFKQLDDGGSSPSDESGSSDSESSSSSESSASSLSNSSNSSDDSSDDGSSSDENSSDSGSSSSSDNSSEGRGHRNRQGRRRQRRPRHSRSRRRRRSAQRRTLIKPTPPDKYSGQVDYRAFHRFLTHGTAYVKYGYVEKRRQVMVLSEFLSGKAYTFYTRRVALAPHKWTLKEFFTELFNYCFPIDYRNQQRARLEALEQGNSGIWKSTLADY